MRGLPALPPQFGTDTVTTDFRVAGDSFVRVVTLVVGAVVESASELSLQPRGTGLVSDTDGPFLVAASLPPIGVARVVRRRRRPGERAR